MSKEFNIVSLRDNLFKTLAALQVEDNPMDLGRARAISELSGRIIETARVEIDYMKATNAKRGSGFIPHVEPEDDHGAQTSRITSTGVESTVKAVGGNIITHRAR